jgi:type I restriction enzyme S subunit
MKYPRYPAYRDSGVEWIGEIPEHWQVLKLKRVLSTLEAGMRESGGALQDGGALSIGGEHIGWDGKLILSNPKYISEIFYDNLNSGKVSKDDILLVKDGATIGKCTLIKEKPQEKCSVNEHVFILRAIRNYSPEFLYFFLSCHVGQEQLKVNIQGAAQGGLNLSFAYKTSITKLPLNEQFLISKFLQPRLSRISNVIFKQEKLIELLQEKRQAIITHAVTKGLDPNVPMKDSGVEWIGEIPEKWKILRIKTACLVNPSKREISNLSKETVVSFLPMENIGDDNTINLSLNRPISDVERGYTYFREEDIVIAKITPCFENGKGALIRGLPSQIGFGTTELIVLRAKPILNREFLYYLTISNPFRKIGESQMYGSAGQKRISDDFVKEFRLALPPVEEQKQITIYLESQITKIDALVTRLQNMKNILNEYRSSLISAAVTGKIDVRNVHINESLEYQ